MPAQDSLLPATGAQAHSPRDPKSLPRLRDMTTTFLFAGSTSSEAEHISQRQTHTGMYMQDMTRLVTQTATDKVLPSTAPAYRTHINTSTDSQVPYSSWADRGRRSLVQQSHTTCPRLTSTCTFVSPLSTSTAPLSAQHPCLHPGPLTYPTGPLLTHWSSSVLAEHMQHSHTHLRDTSKSWVHWIPAQIPHPPDTSATT